MRGIFNNSKDKLDKKEIRVNVFNQMLKDNLELFVERDKLINIDENS